MTVNALIAQVQNLYSSNSLNSGQSNYFDGFLQSMMTYNIIFLLISIILFVLIIMSWIRRWMVQTAIFEMSEDIRDIRNQIVKSGVSNCEDIVKSEPLQEENPEATEKLSMINDMAEDFSMVLEKAKVTKTPKWVLFISVAIIIVLSFLNIYFFIVK